MDVRIDAKNVRQRHRIGMVGNPGPNWRKRRPAARHRRVSRGTSHSTASGRHRDEIADTNVASEIGHESETARDGHRVRRGGFVQLSASRVAIEFETLHLRRGVVASQVSLHFLTFGCTRIALVKKACDTPELDALAKSEPSLRRAHFESQRDRVLGALSVGQGRALIDGDDLRGNPLGGRGPSDRLCWGRSRRPG